MGCLIPKARTQLENILPKQKRKIVMVGLDNAGKTSILNQMKINKFMDTVPTIGLNVETVRYKELEFLMFDVGGKVRSLWSHYYDNLDALIFVVDSTDRERLWMVKDELIKLNSDLKFSQAIVLALFNKQDLPKCLEFNTLVEETGVNEVLEMDVIVQKCSAKTGEGLWEGFEKLVNYFVSNSSQHQNKEPLKKMPQNGQTNDDKNNNNNNNFLFIPSKKNKTSLQQQQVQQEQQQQEQQNQQEVVSQLQHQQKQKQKKEKQQKQKQQQKQQQQQQDEEEKAD